MMRKLLPTVLTCLLALNFYACGDDEEENNNSNCEQACESKNECPLGQTCSDGCCVETGCDPAVVDTCPAGQFCDEFNQCQDCGANTVSCMLIGSGGQLPLDNTANSTMSVGVDSSIQLKGVALDGNAFPIYCAQFDWAVSSGSGASINNGVLTVSEAGSVTVTGTVSGAGTVSCDLDVEVMDEPMTDMAQIYVYEDVSGEPIENATVVLDTNTDDPYFTAADGTVINVDLTGVTGDFMISVFKDDYSYVTIAGLNKTDNSDIAIPLARRPKAGPEVSGFGGNLDFTEYQQEYTGGRELTLHAAFAGTSIPLNAVFNLDVEALIGTIEEDCENNPDAAGCYTIDITGDPVVTPLPGGLVVGTKTKDIKEHYDALGVPGRRLGWTLGGQAELTAIIPLVDLFTSSVAPESDEIIFDPALIFNGVTPLLPRFASGISGDLQLQAGSMSDWDSWRSDPLASRNSDYPVQDMTVREGLRVYREMTVNSFPADPYLAGQNFDSMVIASGYYAHGYGLIPAGLTAGLDVRSASDDANGNYKEDGNEEWTADGVVDGAQVCTPGSTCPYGVDGTVSDGNLGMFFAPAHSGLQSSQPMTIVASLPMGSLAEGTLDAESYGPVRVAGLVLPRLLGESEAVSASDFIGFSGEPVLSEADRTYTANSVNGAHMHMVAFAEDYQENSTRWYVYMANDKAGTVELPNVPASLNDPVHPDEAWSILHTTFKLNGTTSFADLVKNNGMNLDRAGEAVSAFSVYMSYGDPTEATP